MRDMTKYFKEIFGKRLYLECVNGKGASRKLLVKRIRTACW